MEFCKKPTVSMTERQLEKFIDLKKKKKKAHVETFIKQYNLKVS